MKDKKPHTYGWWRPKIVKTPEEFYNKVEEYFEWVKGDWHWEAKSDEDGNPKDMKVFDRDPEPVTITGLCLFMGFSSKQSLYDYCKYEDFKDVANWARLRVENYYEKALSGRMVTGPIFALKQMGWSDKQEVDHTTKGQTMMPNIVWEFTDSEKKK